MSSKIFIDFNIELSIELYEKEKQKVMNDISLAISKLLDNKYIIKTNISVESTDNETVLLSMLLNSDLIES